MSDDIETDLIGFFPGHSFDLEEATSLINHEIVQMEDKQLLPKPPHDKVGFIVGVLHVNEEIELVIRLDRKLAQVTKAEFEANFLVVPEPF